MKIAVIVGVVALLAGGGWYVGGCLQEMSDKVHFSREVREYFEPTSRAAAYRALELARPHLEDETRGKFLGRLEVLDGSGRSLILGVPVDSYVKVISDIGAALYSWALKQRRAVGYDERDVFLRQTPLAKVGNFGVWLHDLLMLQINPGDLVKARATFADLKGKLDAAIPEPRKG